MSEVGLRRWTWHGIWSFGDRQGLQLRMSPCFIGLHLIHQSLSLWTSGSVRAQVSELAVVRVVARAWKSAQLGEWTASVCVYLASLFPSSYPPHSPLRIALPHWQSSWDGQSGAVSCSAKGQAADPSQARQTVSPESLNPKENSSREEVVGTDSSWQRCIQETACYPCLSGYLGLFWLLFFLRLSIAPFFFDSYPSSKFLAFW